MRGLLVSVVPLAACLAALCTSGQANDLAGEAPVVLKIQLRDEPITPVTVSFIRRVLQTAEEIHAECLLIELDTPGGLLQSTQEIVKAILTSDVPVVVYVAPAGARAASAGLLITLASHVSAMAPGTRIGAAHPVQVGGLPIQPELPSQQPTDEESADKTDQRDTPMKRAMAKQAESERERRAKVIHAEGEQQAAARLREAAAMIKNHPMAMQMRFLQTLVEVGSENNTTIVFPVPLELASTFLQSPPESSNTPREETPPSP